MFIATLVAANRLSSGELSAAQDALAQAGCVPGAVEWLVADNAADIAFDGDMESARSALAPLLATHDIFVQPTLHRRKRLLVSDMDSTMIAAECIDELADYAGLKAEISAVTERAMRGEMDFAEALVSRVALLKGLPVSAVAECLAERVRPMPGAKTLIATMRGQGAHCVLVSGGFHHFADPVAADLGFHAAIANVLEVADGKLTGRVTGAIVDAARKAEVLHQVCAERGFALADSMGLGDGANDIPLIQASGYGIAYHAKPKARAAADAFIAHGDLTSVLLAQGIRPGEWLGL